MWVLVATILASSMAFIDGSALNVVLPALQEDLRADAAALLWIVNGYLLMLAALILPGGALGDRFGRKRVFMAGIALFLAASAACGLAPTAPLLVAARFLQGAGGALMIPGSLALLNASVPEDQRGAAIGTWSAVTTLVTLGAPVLGGFLAEGGLWRGVFFVNLPLGAAALAILATRVPESRNADATGMDLPGAALVALGLGAWTYGFTVAPELGWGDPRVVGSVAGGVGLLGAFVAWQFRSPSPMVPMHLFRNRTFAGCNLLTLLLYGALGAGPFFLVLDLVQAQGYPERLAGLALLPFILCIGLLSRWTGRLADRTGPRPWLFGGPAVCAVGFGLLALPGLTGGPSAYWTTFFPGLLVLGLGMAATVAPLTTAVMGALDTRWSGTASGINNPVSRAAGVLTLAVVGALVLHVFSAAIRDSEDLGPAVRQAVLARAGDLGAVRVPGAELAVRRAFASARGVALQLCAVMALLAGFAGWFLVEPKRG